MFYGHVSHIRKVLLTSTRAIFSVYQTTPCSALFREVDLPPPENELNKRSRQAILRIYRLDYRHPLKKRIIWAWKFNRCISRLSTWTLSLLKMGNIDPLISPPWAKTEYWQASIKRVSRYHFPLPFNIPHQDLVAYTDASYIENLPNPKVDGGIIIYQAE